MADSTPSWFVGVDIGGTFTDLVAVDVASGRRVSAKVLTTPADPGQGILDAVAQARAEHGLTLADTTMFAHATTLAINTVIERTGARVGLIATRGFRDVLEVGYANRYDMFDLQIQRQPPLVDRPLRLEVDERITADGEVLHPLDAASVDAAIAALDAAGVESVSICLLHGYKNASHEIAVRDALARRNSALTISISSEVAPVIREYERTLATTINAYVAPKLSRYLGRLTEMLDEGGYEGEAHIMRSDGGWFAAEEASKFPVRILESGPAAGAIVAANTAARSDAGLALAFDMGGTTAKACLLVGGKPSITDELEVSRLERFKKDSGLPLRLPSVDLIEIGAGGGSIASINPIGLLQVGPASAGAVPGPACYGRGGDRPTVTDADLLLGYLDPVSFAGGTMALDVEAATSAVRSHLLGGDRGDDLTAAAWGVHDLVNENMTLAMRMHCVEHGVHPAGIAIVATGGAGPLHATGILEKLHARCVICPLDVGVASAMGLLLAPKTDERTLTDIQPLLDYTPEQLEARLAEIAEGLHSGSDWSGTVERQRSLSMRLRGQGYEVTVPLPDQIASTAAVADVFRTEYALRFGRPPSADGQIEIVDWSVRLVERGSPISAAAPESGSGEAETADAPTRPAYWGPAFGWLETGVYQRALLRPGRRVDGPAVVEERTSTIVVRPRQSASVDAEGNLVIVPV